MDLKGIYTADANRYTDSEALYKRCGKSGVLLPKVSLGFWHNFGGVDPYERSRAITSNSFIFVFMNANSYFWVQRYCFSLKNHTKRRIKIYNKV